MATCHRSQHLCRREIRRGRQVRRRLEARLSECTRSYTMFTVGTVTKFLQHFAPLELAESWDNVGLLLGDASVSVEKVMTCLTVTPASATEAISAGAQLIVTHHPILFRPTQRITN